MSCIRIFRTREEAEWAKAVLEEGGIHATISEDTFNGIPIQTFGVPARFRIIIPSKDFDRAARYLSTKLHRKTS